MKENEWAADGMKIADQTCLLWALPSPIHTPLFFLRHSDTNPVSLSSFLLLFTFITWMDQPTNRPQLNHSRSCPNIPALVVENDDDDGGSGTTQQLPLAPEEQHDDDDNDDDMNDSSDTRVDAVLDHRDARDRHVRFQEHVVESAALVERMLSLSGRHQSPSSPVNRYQTKIHHDIDEPEDDIDDKISDKGSSTATNKTAATPGAGGGSVLSSLMRLEAQRRQKEQEYEIKKQQRKAKRVSIMDDVKKIHTG